MPVDLFTVSVKSATINGLIKSRIKLFKTEKIDALESKSLLCTCVIIVMSGGHVQIGLSTFERGPCLNT